MATTTTTDWNDGSEVKKDDVDNDEDWKIAESPKLSRSAAQRKKGVFVCYKRAFLLLRFIFFGSKKGSFKTMIACSLCVFFSQNIKHSL